MCTANHFQEQHFLHEGMGISHNISQTQVLTNTPTLSIFEEKQVFLATITTPKYPLEANFVINKSECYDHSVHDSNVHSQYHSQ